MARLTFADDRSAFRAPARDGLPIRSAKDAPVTVYLDAAASQVATDLTTMDGTPITSGLLHIDAFSMLPLFKGPNDGRDTLYVVIDGGPVNAIYARADDRLDALAAQLAALTAGTSSDLSAEAAARIAADSAETSARAAAVIAEAAARAATDSQDVLDDAAEATARALADSAESAARAALDAREAANNAAQAAAIGDEATARAAAVSAEASARSAADTALQASITANTSAISNEGAFRVAGDTNTLNIATGRALAFSIAFGG